MNHKDLIIIALIVITVYLYYQNRSKPNLLGSESKVDQNLLTFLQTNLNSNNLEELKTKLGEKSLNELLEENEDYETEVDTLTRTKDSLEQDLSVQATAFQNRLREKDREIKKFKEDLASEKKRADKTQEKLNSEKQISKGSVERITKLTEQITNLEKEQEELKKQVKKMPGSWDETEWPPLTSSKKDKK